MKTEFESTLKDNDVTLIGHPLTENQQILSIEVKLKWSIDPTGGSYGFKFWHCILESFELEMTIEDIDSREKEIIQFDSHHLDYEMDIDLDNYRMKDDFIITDVEIDKSENKVIAIIQRGIE